MTQTEAESWQHEDLQLVRSNADESMQEACDTNSALEPVKEILSRNHADTVNVYINMPVVHDNRRIQVNEHNMSDCNVNISTSAHGSESLSDEDTQSNSMRVNTQEDEEIKSLEILWNAQRILLSGNQTLERIAESSVLPPIVRQRLNSTRITAVDKQNRFTVEYPRNSYEIHFDDLLSDSYSSKFIALIGFPGSGKTVLSRKLARRYRNLPGFACFYIKFSDINYGDETLSLRELLLDKMHPNLTPNDCEVIFNWIVQNDERCVIIFDAFNEAEWQIERIPPAQTYDKQLVISDLVASLFKRHFLPRSTLIITSRPNSMTTLQKKQLLPKILIYLKEFSLSAVKSLCEQHQFEPNIYQIIDDISSQLLSMCQNPKLLIKTRDVISYLLNDSSDFPNITTVYENLVETMFSHFVEVHEEISCLSYRYYDKDFYINDLEEMSICCFKTQDLIVAKYAKESMKNLNTINLCFLHKTFQAYFAALHIHKSMKYQDFKDFVESYLFRPAWVVVRRFLLGLFTNKTSDTSCEFMKRIFHPIFPQDVTIMKRICLISNLIERIKDQCEEFKNNVLGVLDEDMMEVSGETLQMKRHFVDLCGDVREYNCPKLSKLIVSRFPSSLVLNVVVLSSSDCHALAFVLKEVPGCIAVIDFTECKLTDHSFSHICSAILQMPGSVDHLKIGHNYFSNKIAEEVVKILPKVKRVSMQNCVVMSNRGKDKRSLNQEEQQILQAGLNKLKYEGSMTKTILVDNDPVIILKKKKDSCSTVL